MRNILLIFIFLNLTYFYSYSQGTCATADPFCTGTTYNFPAGVNTGSAETGPNYGCLGSEPNPVWYYLKIANSGNIEIHMQSSNGKDIDFICWGPFTNATTPCTAQLTGGSGLSSHHSPGSGGGYPSGNIVDCSYNSDDEEWDYIPNAVTGQYYLLLITNYSNQACNIIFSQTGGNGSTDCSILAPPPSNNGPICEGQTLQLSVPNQPSGTTYSWTGPGSWSSTSQNPSRPNATPAMSGTYSLVITYNGQSSPASTTQVTVYAKPTVTATASPNPICLGSSTTLTGGGASTYSWNNGLGAGNPKTASPTVATTYIVTGTDSHSCTNTGSVTVNINPKPTVTATANPSAICYGTSTSLTGSGANTYAWNNGLGTGNPITASPTSNTTYIVTGTDGNGCTNTASVSVTINPNITPVITHAKPTTFCIGDDVTLDAGAGNASYSWSTSATTQTITVNTAGTYSVSVTNMSGCSGITSIATTVNPLPTVSAGVDINMCLGNTAVLTGTGGINYSWSNSSFSNPNNVTPTTNTTYFVTVEDANGCKNTDDVNVTLYPITSDFTIVSPICMDNSTTIVYTGNGSTNAQYNWDYTTSGNPTGSGQGPITVLFSSPGTYNITLTVHEPNCTLSTPTIVPVTVYNIQNSMSSTDVLCFGGNTGGASVTTNGGTGSYTYNWSNGQTSNSISNLDTGTYTVTVTNIISSNQTCIETSSVTINQPTQLVADINNSTPPLCYNGQNGTATVTASGGTNGYSYTWSPIGGSGQTGTGLADGTYIVTVSDANNCTATDEIIITEPTQVVGTITGFTNASCYNFSDGTAGASASGGVGNYTYTWSTTPQQTNANATNLHSGTYYVTIYDGNNCTASQSVTVNQPTQIGLSISSNNESCVDQCNGSASASVNGGTSPYTYYWNTSSTGYAINSLCVGQYTVTVTDDHHCTTTNSVYISTYSLITASAIASPYSGVVPLTVDFTFNGSGATGYLWDFGDGTPTSTDQNPSHIYNSHGLFTVTLTVNSGSPYNCQDVFTMTLEVLQPSNINTSNVFSPNGDGVNDYFYIQSEGLVKEEVTIYNRWGEKLFSWDTPGGKWDGCNYSGAKQSDGTYFYILNARGYDNVDYSRNGNISLIR